MSSRSATSRILPPSAVRTHGEDGSPAIRSAPPRQLEADLSDISAQRQKRIDADNRRCSERFSRAVDAWGKHSSYADEIGVSQGTLSEILSGKRVVQLRHTLPLYKHPVASKVWLDWQCEEASLAPVRPKRRVRRKKIAFALLAVVEAMGMWPLYREHVASRLGETVEDTDLGLTSQEESDRASDDEAASEAAR
jgi:hypothetical protein